MVPIPGSRPAKRVVAFYNKRGTCEQWIKEGKGAIKWTRLSCRSCLTILGTRLLGRGAMQPTITVIERPEPHILNFALEKKMPMESAFLSTGV
jgi:hypothetical protein